MCFLREGRREGREISPPPRGRRKIRLRQLSLAPNSAKRACEERKSAVQRSAKLNHRGRKPDAGLVCRRE